MIGTKISMIYTNDIYHDIFKRKCHDIYHGKYKLFKVIY